MFPFHYADRAVVEGTMSRQEKCLSLEEIVGVEKTSTPPKKSEQPDILVRCSGALVALRIPVVFINTQRPGCNPIVL